MTAQLSRERIEEIANFESDLANKSFIYEDARRMACMLLAGMDSKPVAYIGKQMLESLCDEGGRTCGRVWRSDTDELSGESRIPLYAAPPAPVAVPDCFRSAVSALESLYRNGQKQCWHERYTTDMAYASGVLNACRVAMLNTGPVTGWIKCSEQMSPLNNGQMWIYSPTRGVQFMFALAASGEYYDTCDSEEDITDATHWMPIVIPAAPEQEV